MLIPVGLSLLIGFYKEDTSLKTEILFTAIPAVMCFATFALFFYVVVTRGFDDAFERMARTQQREEDPKDGEDEPLMAAGGVPLSARSAASSIAAEGMCDMCDGRWVRFEGAFIRSAETGNEDEGWFGPTLGVCLLVMGLTHTMSTGFVPMMQAVAGLQYAHILMLVRFFAEFVGRLCSHLWGFSYFGDYFGAKTMLLITIIRLILVGALVFEAFSLPDIKTSKTLKISYALQVFIFYVLGNYVNSETMALAISARPRDTRTVAYVMMVLTYVPNVVSLIVVISLLQHYGFA
jgi:hypothetical protein